MATTFGQLLRHHRLAAGLSQEALAERARISVQAVGALERGDRRSPQRDTLALLADALGLSSDARREFEAAAASERTSAPRHGRTPAAAGPAPAAGLPRALTSFVGREDERHALAELALERRLVTITGGGGFGKTRLALEVAGELESAFDAVAFVDLSATADPSLVTAAIASALSVRETLGRPLLETLLQHLRATRALLVLDNCEQVVDEVARVAETLLLASPELWILATSREPLRVPGEHLYRLTPLSAREAVVLFTERARAADHRFALTGELAPVVAEICARLDGIPLAVELAAARVTALGVRGLAKMLERRFALPGVPGRGAPERHQAMRATIDWSYDLLSESEKRVFERLSVFAGGCTLEAAWEVCRSDGEGRDGVFAVMSSLVDKSLLVADARGAEARYRMLESFREYAREKLRELGDLDGTARRHGRAFAELAARYERAAHESGDDAWRESSRSELDNFRAALEWALGAGNDVALGQGLASAMRPVWYFADPAEGKRWLRLALDAVNATTPPGLAAKVETAYAAINAELGDFSEMLTAALRAADSYRTLGDVLGTSRAQIEAATALVRLARPLEAEPLLTEVLESGRAVSDRTIVAKGLTILAWLYGKDGDFGHARDACGEALAIYEALGQDNSEAVTLVTLAEIEFWSGDAERAVALARNALSRCRADTLRATACDNLAAYHVAAGRFDEARMCAREALEISGRFGFVPQETWALQHLAAIAALRPGDGETLEHRLRAARLLGFVDARYATIGERPEPTDAREYEEALRALEAALGGPTLEAERSRGAAMGEEDALAEASRI